MTLGKKNVIRMQLCVRRVKKYQKSFHCYTRQQHCEVYPWCSEETHQYVQLTIKLFLHFFNVRLLAEAERNPINPC